MEHSHRPRPFVRTRDVRHLSVFLIAAAALAASACGKDDGQPDGGGNPSEASSGEDEDAGLKHPNYDIEGCVVSVLATDCGGGLPTPHVVELLNARTDEALIGFRTTSAAGGKYSFKNVPGDVDVAVHAIGVGPVTESASTYDSIAFNDPDSGENLLRVSSVGTATLAGMAANFTPADDKVALSGAVYRVDDHGKRVGTVGCAKIYLDDEPHPAVSADQRYNGVSGIPVTLAKLEQTLAGSGRFYFGNLATGEHTLKVSMDGGRSFIAARTIVLGKARKDAVSPYKALLYLVGIDIKGQNPMPAGCATEEMP